MTKQFDELTPAEADEVLVRFAEERPQALAHLRERLFADGQDPDGLLDGSVASLEPLWVWTKEQLRPRADGAWQTETEPFEGQPAPAWFRHETREEPTLSLESVQLLDGVIAYIGDVMMAAVPGTAWRRGHEPVRGWIDQNRPVLARGSAQIGVTRRVTGLARAHLVEPGTRPDSRLREVVELWVDQLRQAAPAPDQPREPVLDVALDAEISVEPGDAAGEWIVELSDDVRLLVGDAATQRLADTLPGNLGVTDAEFEDREVLVVRGRLDPDELKRWVVAELGRNAAS